MLWSSYSLLLYSFHYIFFCFILLLFPCLMHVLISIFMFPFPVGIYFFWFPIMRMFLLIPSMGICLYSRTRNLKHRTYVCWLFTSFVITQFCFSESSSLNIYNDNGINWILSYKLITSAYTSVTDPFYLLGLPCVCLLRLVFVYVVKTR